MSWHPLIMKKLETSNAYATLAGRIAALLDVHSLTAHKSHPPCTVRQGMSAALVTVQSCQHKFIVLKVAHHIKDQSLNFVRICSFFFLNTIFDPRSFIFGLKYPT